MTFKDRKEKLAEACLLLAKDIDNKKGQIKKLGKLVCFKENGAPCCAVGHVVQRAGMARNLGKFKGITFDGKKGAVWWDGLETVAKAMGVSQSKVPTPVCDALDSVQIANDTKNGDTRRMLVAAALTELARVIKAW